VAIRRFSDIDLGLSSAEAESAANPALLLQGFLDFGGIREKVLDGPKFLILGYKGSGKSAVSEHLRLSAEGDPNLFVPRMFLADFPFTDFGKILRGSEDVASRYPATWSWLLLLQILNSFASDEGATSTDPDAFGKTVDLLKRYGLLPTPSPHEIVLKSSERNFRISLAKTIDGAATGSRSVTADVNFLSFVEILRRVARSVRSESKHVLVIDGLDDVLLRDPIQYDALSALAVEVDRLNTTLNEASAPAKVILLCRTDIYDRLPGQNLNKLRQDSSVSLNWYSDPQHPERSHLVSLAIAKAAVSDPKLGDIFAAFLPDGITYGPRRVSTKRFLLERTRHLPRDFLQLLKAIQEAGDRHRGRLSEEAVLSGMRAYSHNYFLGEIRDELAGHFSPDERDAGLDGLVRLGQNRFHVEEFARAVQGVNDFDAHRFLLTLYDCGAVGTSDASGFYRHRYRNPQAPFDDRAQIVLHRALAPALNVGAMAQDS
jgi:hypothetical protein